LYYHLLRKPDTTVYEKHNRELRPVIERICAESTKQIGAEKIRQKLIEMGFSVSKRKVLELLRETYPWKHQSHERPNCSINWPKNHKNILDRDFSPPRPNMVWLSDITTIKTDSGNFYLCVVMDLFARRIVAARLSASQDVSLIRYTFQDAFYNRRKPDGLIFHSDQGGQYRSYEFQSLLLRHKVRQSFSKLGVPYDNAPMESFFASLKVEEIYRFRYTGIGDLSASLRDYISFYNNMRPHTSIGGRTPIEAENEYFQKQSTFEKNECAPLAQQK